MENKKINAGIIGATGYAGAELFRLLSCHANVNISAVSSTSFEGKSMASISLETFPRSGNVKHER